MCKVGRRLTAVLGGLGLVVALSAMPANAQDEVLNQSERDYVLMDNALTPAKGQPNLMATIGYADVDNDGGANLGAVYDMPLSDRLTVGATAFALIADSTVWDLGASLKYQLGSFGMQSFQHAVLGRLAYTDGPGDGSVYGTLKWATTYYKNRDSISGNVGVTVADGRKMGIPFGLGWTHRFGKWRTAVEWAGEVVGGDLYSNIGPSVWYYLPSGNSEAQTSVGLGATFGVGESDGWGVNLMGQWHP